MNKRLSHINVKQILLSLILLIVLAGCGATMEGPKPTSIPSSHAWQYLHSYGNEELGYATYSYVLVGRDKNNQKSTELYYELVEDIQSSTVQAKNLKDYIPKNYLNLFLIPATINNDLTYYKPNFELSKLLLTSIAISAPLKLSRPGPYIITFSQPINSINKNKTINILYIDLTNAHQKAIPEIVRTYKNKIIDNQLNGIEKLKSIRLSLLNIALLTEDSIGFATVAYADVKKTFFGSTDE